MNNHDIAEIEADIAELPMESQLRVNMIADMLRDMMDRDSESSETTFAMLIVMEEWGADNDAVEMDLAKGMTRQ
jgi:hypothetical protein